MNIHQKLHSILERVSQVSIMSKNNICLLTGTTLADFSTTLTTVFCPEVLFYPGNLSVKGFSLLTGVNRHGNLCCNPNLLRDNLCSRLEISRQETIAYGPIDFP